MRFAAIAAIARRRRKLLLLGGEPPSASQSTLTPDTASVVTANGSSTIAYTGVLRDENGVAITGRTGVTVEAVEWFPLSRILADSFVSVSATTIASDDVDEVTITVQLVGYRNGQSYPLVGVAAADIAVAVSGTGNTIAALSGTTDADGIISTTFTTTQASTVKTISATLFGDALTATATCESDGAGGGSGLFFEDDFDGGVRTNAGGFTWTSANAGVSLVAGGYGASSHALQFSFGPNAAGVDDSAEQRFNMGQNVAELWIDTQVKFPTGYVHRNESPSNNKMLRLWADDYGDIGKVGASTWYSATAANGSNVRFDRNTGSGIGPSGSPNVELDLTLNAWTRVRWHWLYPDSVTELGLVELWFDAVKVGTWAFDGSYIVANPHWNQGYLFGYSNSGFTDETNILVGYVAFHNTDPGW